MKQAAPKSRIFGSPKEEVVPGITQPIVREC